MLKFEEMEFLAEPVLKTTLKSVLAVPFQLNRNCESRRKTILLMAFFEFPTFFPLNKFSSLFA